MSFTRIFCTGCGSGGLFFLTLKMSYSFTTCDCCHDHRTGEDNDYFCSLECMQKWLAKHEIFEKGMHCPRCIDYKSGKSSGFSGGFESNGICKTCQGTGRIKEMVKDKVEPNPETMALQAAFQKKIEDAGGYDAFMKARQEEADKEAKKNKPKKR